MAIATAPRSTPAESARGSRHRDIRLLNTAEPDHRPASTMTVRRHNVVRGHCINIERSERMFHDLKNARFLRHKIPLLCSFAALVGPAVHAAPPTRYVQHNLVSDGFVPADVIDPNLINAWGIAPNPTGV